MIKQGSPDQKQGRPDQGWYPEVPRPRDEAACVLPTSAGGILSVTSAHGPYGFRC